MWSQVLKRWSKKSHLVCREAEHAVDHLSGEQRRGNTVAAAEALIQVEECREIEFSKDKTPYSVVVKRKGRQGGQEKSQTTSSPKVLAAGPPGAWGLREKKTLKTQGWIPWEIDRR